jgi:hypothetical protein
MRHKPRMNEPEPIAQPIACPRCRRGMEFVRSIPKVGLLPELRVYSCPSCREAETKEILLH